MKSITSLKLYNLLTIINSKLLSNVLEKKEAINPDTVKTTQ